MTGLGFGLFLCYQVMPAVRRGELEILLNDFEPEPLPVAFMYPQSRMLCARTRSFLDWTAPVLTQSLTQKIPRPSTR